MAKYCPVKDGPALYLDCKECDERVCEEDTKSRAESLVEMAKNKYPVSVSYIGRLSEPEQSKIEENCDINCPAVYMDGSAMYSIRYRRSVE